MFREIYQQRVTSAVQVLNQEEPILGGCSRLATATFLGTVLEGVPSQFAYELKEWKAGLRWLSVFSSGNPDKAIQTIFTQADIPIEGLIITTVTKKEGGGHTIALVFDANSRKNEGILCVDALMKEQKYNVFPDIDSTLQYIGENYDLNSPGSIRAVIPVGAKVPPPNRGVTEPGGVGQWFVEGVTLVGELLNK